MFEKKNKYSNKHISLWFMYYGAICSSSSVYRYSLLVGTMMAPMRLSIIQRPASAFCLQRKTSRRCLTIFFFFFSNQKLWWCPMLSFSFLCGCVRESGKIQPSGHLILAAAAAATRLYINSYKKGGSRFILVGFRARNVTFERVWNEHP